MSHEPDIDDLSDTALGKLPEHGHDPVMARQVLDLLAIEPGQTAVDCTLGRGGHASMLADRVGPTGLLIGMDADSRNLTYVRQRLAEAPCRVLLVHANFAELPRVLEEAADELGRPLSVDALLADLGVSTNQLLDAEYGLSFSLTEDAPLDMRLDPRLTTSAADLLNRLPERELADTLYQLAGERFSFRIARRIVETRRREPITTTRQLAELIRSVVPRPRPRYGKGKGSKPSIDPATRSFMALRMRVNSELDRLSDLLAAIPAALAPGGRAAVISFHSGEDRLVKHTFRDAAKRGELEVLTKSPLVPDDAELDANPRSRSAKLRAVRKVG